MVSPSWLVRCSWPLVTVTVSPAGGFEVEGSLLVVVTFPAVVLVSAIALAFRYPWFRDVVMAAGGDPNVGWSTTLIGLAWVLCGVVVVWRTGNLVGWISIVVGLLFGLQWVGWAIWDLARLGQPIDGAFGVVGAFLHSGWYPALVLMAVVLPVVFPTGRPPTSKWVWVLVAAGVALTGYVAYVSVHLIMGTVLEAFGDDLVTTFLVFAPQLVGVIGAVASMVTRFRRAAGTERQQIKWVVAALIVTCLVLALLFFDVLAPVFGPIVGPRIGLASFGLVPVAMTLAMLRFRLYDIDRIIARTVSYGLVVGAPGRASSESSPCPRPCFPASQMLPLQCRPSPWLPCSTPCADESKPHWRDVSTAGSTTQNRWRFSSQAWFRDEVDPARIVDGWLGAVTKTMQPEGVGVWVRVNDGSK